MSNETKHVKIEDDPVAHKQRHRELHRALDELVADWIWQAEGRPSGATVLELINWSYEQTWKPTNKPI